MFLGFLISATAGQNL